MDKETRNAIERATQRARKVLEEDFAAQLEGDFDVQRDGSVAAKAGGHLSARQAFQRERIVAAVEHKRAAGMNAADSVADYLRDAAFTTLNRFVALKMLEARELVQECITKGEQSAGYREFCGMAPGLPLLPDSAGYRLYIESIFDELSTEVKVLFDRRDPSSVLWPKRATFEELLEILNATELARVWGEDETIGWVYQFFNGQDERRKMREQSQAPRNSRELAVRNQFFTPRYVVQFLTDNTLGRIWYEMRKGDTALATKCEYMVRRPSELFRTDPAMLENAPAWVARALDGDFAAIPEGLDFGTCVPFAHGIDGYANEVWRRAQTAGGGGEQPRALRLERIFEETGRIEGTAAELWTALFLACRGDRHAGGWGAEGAKPFRDGLCQALRAALLAEHDASARVVLVPHRPKKDPRDIRVLDPACGSGHFLLYAFDLFLTIYEEAWADGHSPPSEVTGQTLRDDYATLEDLRKAIPGLILAHNLHGVDIDPRCAQIAQLALWMRVQRAYRDLLLARIDRPQIRRSNVVIAEPLVADEHLAKEFVARLGDADLGRAFTALVSKLDLAGDLGLLLPVETFLTRSPERGKTGSLFAPPEERIRATLVQFASHEERASTGRRLFVDDAEQGIGLLRIAEKSFDVVLMNPPFGEPTKAGKKATNPHLATCDDDLGAAFIHASATRWARAGLTGVVSSSTLWFKHTLAAWRERVLVGDESSIAVGAHLGGHVLDNASVGAAATVLGPRRKNADAVFFRCLRAADKAAVLVGSIRDRCQGLDRPPAFSVTIAALRAYRKSPLVYWISPALRSHLTAFPSLEGNGADVRVGVQCSDDPRFVRAWWELPVERVGARKDWLPFAKSSEYSPFWDDITWLIRWAGDGKEVRAYENARPQNTQYFGRPGVTFPARAVLGFNPRAFPSGIGFGHMGSVAFPKQTTTAETLLGYLSSRPAEYILSFSNGSIQGRKGAYQNHYEVGQVGDLPWPEFAADVARRVGELGDSISSAAMLLLRNDETTHQHRPAAALRSAKTLDEFILSELAEDERLVAIARSTRAALDDVVAAALGFKRQDVDAMNEEFAECDAPTEGPWSPRRPTLNDALRREMARSLTSLAVGLAIGRFDIRRFGEAAPEPSPLEHFDVAPVTLLRTRRPKGYALELPSSGMFVVDRADPDRADRLVGDALAHVWPNAAPDGLSQLCEALGVDHLSSYLADPGPSGFYADHAHRYSKGRRRAPLYAWFGTASGAFGVLVMAPAATADTLFILRNEILAPRIARAERVAEAARSETGEKGTAATRAALSAAEALVAELRAFAAELEGVIPLWAPSVDDGVVVNIAPFHRLIPHRESRAKAEASWKELCEGDLDWSRLAMRLWPERVVPKCAEDRCLAIAHDLEDVFWCEGTEGKWTARKTPSKAVDELVKQRTSPAVRAALQTLHAHGASVKSAGRARGGSRRKAAAVEGRDS